jgi:hypothetical protein
MEQTAVEWLVEQLFKTNNNTTDSKKMDSESIIQQAKEMEQEQSIDFARLCLNKAKDLDILTSFMNAQQYYNENFKQQEQ